MRILFCLLGAVLMAPYCAAPAALAQQSHGPAAPYRSSAPEKNNALIAMQKDIGKLETRIEHFPQALGVVVQMSRMPTADVDCSGTCFFPNSSNSTSWQCGPAKSCRLYCTVNPPAGGCD